MTCHAKLCTICIIAMCDSIRIPMNQHKLFMVFDKYCIPWDSQFWTTVSGVMSCCINVSQVLSRSAETCAAKSTGLDSGTCRDATQSAI